MYWPAGYNSKAQIEKNTLDQNEIDNIKDYSYFLNIKENDHTKNNNMNEHYQYLLLAMQMYQPPVRTSFYNSCQMIRTN